MRRGSVSLCTVFLWLTGFLLCQVTALTTTVENDFNFTVTGIANLEFGHYSTMLSADNSQFVTQGSTAAGAIYVHSESNLGAQDWGDNMVELVPPQPLASITDSSDRLGAYGVVLSADTEHVAACALGWNGGKGICYVWSQSLPAGSGTSYNEHVVNLTASDGASNDYLGQGGITISNDKLHLVACAWQHAGRTGKCYVFSATNQTSWDWHLHETQLFDPDRAAFDDELGMFGADFSEDSTIIASCAFRYGNNEGKVVVFYESMPGARDWQAQRTSLYGSADSGSLGWQAGVTISADNMHILACSYNAGPDDYGEVYVWSELDPGDRSWAGQLTILTASDETFSAKLGVSGAIISRDNQYVGSCAPNYGPGFVGKCYIYASTLETPTGSSSSVQRTWPEEYQLFPNEGNSLGNNRLVLSRDNQHAVTCSWSYESNRGACFLFTQTYPGARDWNNNTVKLLHAGGDATQYLGYLYGARLSEDNHYITACAYGAQNNTGGCYIYEVDQTSDECVSNPCTAGSGTCIDQLYGFNCSCADGYTGDLCEVEINECESTNSSSSSSSSTPVCAHGGNCTDLVNGFYCACPAGYNGTTCTEDVNECDSNPCFNNGTCSDSIANYTCTCPAGYRGDTCAIVMEACELLQQPCVGSNTTCIDLGDLVSFNCTNCDAGFSGQFCSEDMDECVSNPCGANGTCNDTGTLSFNCTCFANYTGMFCEIPPPPLPSMTNVTTEIIVEDSQCDSSPCLNSGVCIAVHTGEEASFNCSCVEQFTFGSFCEQQGIVFSISVQLSTANYTGSIEEIKLQILSEVLLEFEILPMENVNITIQSQNEDDIWVLIEIVSAEDIDTELIDDVILDIATARGWGAAGTPIGIDVPTEDESEVVAEDNFMLYLVMIIAGLCVLFGLALATILVLRKRRASSMIIQGSKKGDHFTLPV